MTKLIVTLFVTAPTRLKCTSLLQCRVLLFTVDIILLRSNRLYRLLIPFCLAVNKRPYLDCTSLAIFRLFFCLFRKRQRLRAMQDTDSARSLNRFTLPVSNWYLQFTKRLLKRRYLHTQARVRTCSAIHISVNVVRQFSRPFKRIHVWTESGDNSIGGRQHAEYSLHQFQTLNSQLRTSWCCLFPIAPKHTAWSCGLVLYGFSGVSIVVYRTRMQSRLRNKKYVI